MSTMLGPKPEVTAVGAGVRSESCRITAASREADEHRLIIVIVIVVFVVDETRRQRGPCVERR